MNTDWKHTALSHLNHGPCTVAELFRLYGTGSSVPLARALNELVAAGHASRAGETYTITEAGRSRYTIDDNCRGW